MRLLDSTRSRSGLPGRLGGELALGGLATGRLACGLLGSGHLDFVEKMLERMWKSDRERRKTFPDPAPCRERVS